MKKPRLVRGFFLGRYIPQQVAVLTEIKGKK